jgi:hypothetical protein
MNKHEPTPTQIRLRLLAAALVIAAGTTAVLIAVIDLKGILA